MYVHPRNERANMELTTDADTCIGYNTLFVTTGLSREETENGKDLPEGKRLWSWLILCDDGIYIYIDVYVYDVVS